MAKPKLLCLICFFWTVVEFKDELPELGRVELGSHHVQSVPGDHRHATEDAGEDETLGFGLDHVDEEDADTGHQQAAGWRDAEVLGQTVSLTILQCRIEAFIDQAASARLSAAYDSW